jgi:hypothetical protein
MKNAESVSKMQKKGDEASWRVEGWNSTRETKSFRM